MGMYISLPLLALTAVLQSTILPQFRILGGQPDLVFLLVLTWAFHAPLEDSVVWAFVGGICQDLLSAMPLGTSSLGMLVMVFVIYFFSRQVYRVNFVALVGFILLGTLLQQSILMLITIVMGRTPTLEIMQTMIQEVALPTTAYNLLALFPVYIFVRLLQVRAYPRQIRV